MCIITIISKKLYVNSIFCCKNAGIRFDCVNSLGPQPTKIEPISDMDFSFISSHDEHTIQSESMETQPPTPPTQPIDQNVTHLTRT